MWTDDYIGIPYSQLRCDDLIARIYKDRLGVVLPGNSLEWPHHCSVVTDIQAFDILVINIRGEPESTHLGLAVNDSDMLHSSEVCGGVVLDRIQRYVPFVRAVLRYKR